VIQLSQVTGTVRALVAASSAAAASIGLDRSKGRLRRGYDADIPSLRATWLHGQLEPPGREGGPKWKSRASLDLIVGAVTGSQLEVAVLGRYYAGRLVTGRWA
jgi:hypothetical protein